jgi:drug/metabolite transporter (DMT)-like permease
MNRRADGVALLVVTIWGVSFTLKKFALEEIDAWAFMAVRYAGMLALAWAVLGWMWLRGRPIGIAREDLRCVVIAGVLGYTVYIPLSTLGLSLTTPFSTTLLMGTSPLFAALLLAQAGVERITIRHVGGMLLAFAGLCVFLSGKLALALASASAGDLLVLVSAACFAGYSIVSKPLGGRYAFPVVVAYTCAAGAIPVTVATLPAALAFDWSRLSPTGWATLAWTIVVPVYLAWGLWAWAVARAGVGRTSTLMYLVPVIGGVTARLLFGEEFDAPKLAGAVLILAGLTECRRRSDMGASARPVAP